MMVTLCRPDFGGKKDSEETDYFDYVLLTLGVNPRARHLVNEIELNIEDFILKDADGRTII